MTAVRTIRRRFTVGRYRAALSVQLVAGVPAGVNVEWDRADPRHLSSADLARYRQLRNAILQSVADELRGPVVVVDMDDGRLVPTAIQPQTAPQ